MKRYDRDYFDHWYRHSTMQDPQRLSRKIALAVAMAEYYLERPIRSVLDIGCGEGLWRAPLLKLRPKLQYLGFDSSEYVIARFGRKRDLRLAAFGDFAYLRPCPPVDLLVCSDVLHYLSSRELNQGLPGIADLCGGVAFLETFTTEDEIVGDTVEFQARSAHWYRKKFRALGLIEVGSYCWLTAQRPELVASALEQSGKPR